VRVDDDAALVASPVVAAMERPAVVAKPSFDEIVELYRMPMLHLARFLLGPEGSPEDIVHDAFLNAYLRFDRIDNPSAYLRRCVTNGCRSEQRRRAVFQRIAPKLATRTLHTEPRDFLLDAIQRLPYRQRVAVVLRYYEDLTNNEIATTLRCTPKAAESLVRNGVQSLRGHLRSHPR
jgi:RNA polymerase sigma factor (sigma-70 family)